MVVVEAVVTAFADYADISWSAAADTDTGRPVDVSKWTNIAVQCTAGTIGTSTMQGSMDGTTWGALGAGMTIPASNGVLQLTTRAKFIRPSFGAGGTGAVVRAIATR